MPGQALRSGGVPVIEFRASIVIGAGSLSFEMVRALVERLPLMVCPRWVDTRTQPIAIDDVVGYLAAALSLPDDGQGRVFEIGGPEVVSYGELMRQYARLRGLRRLFMPVPVLTPRLSGLWLALVTPAQARVGRALVDGLRNTTIVRSDAARAAFRLEPTPLDGGRRARIRQRAIFDPRGLGGRAYWYAVFPVHALVFRGLLRHIARRAQEGPDSRAEAPRW